MRRFVGSCTLSMEKENIRKAGNRRERNVIWRCGGFVTGNRGEGGHTRPGVGTRGLWVGKVEKITRIEGSSSGS